jgi:hypothetical protein
MTDESSRRRRIIWGEVFWIGKEKVTDLNEGAKSSHKKDIIPLSGVTQPRSTTEPQGIT